MWEIDKQNTHTHIYTHTHASVREHTHTHTRTHAHTHKHTHRLTTMFDVDTQLYGKPMAGELENASVADPRMNAFLTVVCVCCWVRCSVLQCVTVCCSC